MAEVSRDADRRYKDKLIRKEKSDTCKKQATLAFRRGDYEKALTCYNKVRLKALKSVLIFHPFSPRQ